MWKAAFFLLVASAALASAFAGGPDRQEKVPAVGQAIRRTTAQESYSFHIQERPGAGSDTGVEGKYQQGQPLYYKANGIEMYRKATVLVYQQDGRWVRSKTGVESDPLRILGATAQVRSARLPHEDVAELGKCLREIRPAGKEENSRIYSATLDREAAQKLARSEVRSVAQGGRARLWVSPRGLIHQYEIVLEVKGRLGNADVDGSTTRTVSLRQAGKTRVEVPAEAAKALR